MNELIKLSEVEFAYSGKKPVIHIEHFSMQAQEKIFLFGPSGCGKSTLLNLVTGTLVANKGIAEVCGRDLTSLTASGRDRHRGAHLGYIFQSFNLISYLTVWENVYLPVMVSHEKGKPQEAKEQVEHLLTRLGLIDLAHEPVSTLSIGQRQRVAAARAFMGHPSLIIADEPTSALDQKNTELFMQLLLEQAQERKLGLLFVSHDERLAQHFDRSVAFTEINQVVRS